MKKNVEDDEYGRQCCPCQFQFENHASNGWMAMWSEYIRYFIFSENLHRKCENYVSNEMFIGLHIQFNWYNVEYTTSERSQRNKWENKT